MKTKFKILLCTICIILFSISIYAYSSLTNFKPKYGTLTTSVNFRSVASTSQGKIRTLSQGTSIKMVGTIDNFYIVQLSTNEIGVVSKDYVKSSSTSPKGALTYTTVDIQNAYTNTNAVLRGGPNTTFRKVATLKENTNVKIIGYIDNWYVVVLENNAVGAIRKDLLTIKSSGSNSGTSSTFTMSDNEKIVFDAINKARKDAGLSELEPDASLFKIARLKAQDMVDNSYFSHTSKKYGSPFEMMKDYNISYKSAGENIAGNPSLENAVKSWLNSNTHKKNILSNSYNYIGIGVSKSDTYGYVIDVMFIGK